MASQVLVQIKKGFAKFKLFFFCVCVEIVMFLIFMETLDRRSVQLLRIIRLTKRRDRWKIYLYFFGRRGFPVSFAATAPAPVDWQYIRFYQRRGDSAADSYTALLRNLTEPVVADDHPRPVMHVVFVDAIRRRKGTLEVAPRTKVGNVSIKNVVVQLMSALCYILLLEETERKEKKRECFESRRYV